MSSSSSDAVKEQLTFNKKCIFLLIPIIYWEIGVLLIIGVDVFAATRCGMTNERIPIRSKL